MASGDGRGRTGRRSMRNRSRLIAGIAVVAAAALLGCAEAPQAPLHFTVVTSKRDGPHWSAAVACPRFDGGSPLAALANRTLAREVATAETFGRTAAAQFKTLGPPTAAYYHDAGATVSLADPELISVYFDTEEYSGGAHPNQNYVAYTFGIVRGRPAAVTLQDLFRPGVDGPRTASDLLMARLRGNPDATFIRDGTVQSIDPAVASEFVVTPTAIVFLLPPYAVGAYVNGSFVVKIPFGGFGGRLDARGPLRPVLR